MTLLSACIPSVPRSQGTQNGIADSGSNVGASGYAKSGTAPPPKRRADINFTDYSWVLKHPLQCYLSGGCQFQKEGPAGSNPATFTTCGDFLQDGAQSPTASRTPQPSTTVSITYPATRTLSARAKSDGSAAVQQQPGAASNKPARQAQAGAGTNTGQDTQSEQSKEGQPDTAAKATHQTQTVDKKGSSFDLIKLMADVSPFKLGLGLVHVVMIICVVGVITVVVLYQAGRRGPRRFPRAP